MIPNTLAISICGRPLVSYSATASRLNSSVNRRFVVVAIIHLLAQQCLSSVSVNRGTIRLRPQIPILIARFVVIGIAMEESRLTAASTGKLVGSLHGFGPLTALILLYGLTMLLTEVLSNATVAVLMTPVGVALSESLGVIAQPILVAVMMAGSAAFASGCRSTSSRLPLRSSSSGQPFRSDVRAFAER